MVTFIKSCLERLGIAQGPQDIRLAALGFEARFTCFSSDQNITPQWYINGKLRTQNAESGRGINLILHLYKFFSTNSVQYLVYIILI